MTINPWNVPPPPDKGDLAEDTLFASVGRALSAWEKFEINLARLFAAVLGPTESIHPAMRAYGAVITFRGRIQMLSMAAETRFIEAPSEVVQPDFKQVISRAQDYGARRNEIAHGVVLPYQDIADENTREGYVLAPAVYLSTKRKFLPSPSLLSHYKSSPSYVYSSKEVLAFARQFYRLATSLNPLWYYFTQLHIIGHLSKREPQEEPDEQPDEL
ncbi:MAG: hypothetical protein ACT4OG_04790 [Alphaproteobacteria bacterium]